MHKETYDEDTMGKFLTSVEERKEKKTQETVQNWKVTQVHCNYKTARPNCGLHSHNHNVTVHSAMGRGQSQAITAIAADNAGVVAHVADASLGSCLHCLQQFTLFTNVYIGHPN